MPLSPPPSRARGCRSGGCARWGWRPGSRRRRRRSAASWSEGARSAEPAHQPGHVLRQSVSTCRTESRCQPLASREVRQVPVPALRQLPVPACGVELVGRSRCFACYSLDPGEPGVAQRLARLRRRRGSVLYTPSGGGTWRPRASRSCAMARRISSSPRGSPWAAEVSWRLATTRRRASWATAGTCPRRRRQRPGHAPPGLRTFHKTTGPADAAHRPIATIAGARPTSRTPRRPRRAPREEEIRLAKRNYGWPEDAKFPRPRRRVPALSATRSAARARRCATPGSPGSRSTRRSTSTWPTSSTACSTGSCRRLGQGPAELPRDAKGLASRDSSGKVLNTLAKTCPG